MKNQKLIEKLEEINQLTNGLIGRLTPGLPANPDSHGIALKIGEKIDDLINKLL